jgi:hypothetical protein
MVFRPDGKHVRYWTEHVLPVAVVLVDPETRRCYWQLVNPDTLSRSSSGAWRLLIPEANVIDESARSPLLEAMSADAYVLRIRDLRLAMPWMEILAAGRRLVVDIHEWINKTSGRGLIVPGEDREDGDPPAKLAEWEVLLGAGRYIDVVPHLFAWADLSIHEETHDDADRERFADECVFVDHEGDRFERMDYTEWRAAAQLEGLRPYANSQGEVDLWRLELTLNDLGKALLRVDAFATAGERQLTR